jgi:hypothetical protein
VKVKVSASVITANTQDIIIECRYDREINLVYLVSKLNLILPKLNLRFNLGASDGSNWGIHTGEFPDVIFFLPPCHIVKKHLNSTLLLIVILEQSNLFVQAV